MKVKDAELTAPCSYCKKNSPFFLRAKDYNRNFGRENFNYYKCSSCQFIFIYPIPENLLKYYPSDYYPIINLDIFLKNVETEGYKVKLIQQFCSSGRILDIGPAMGGFLYLAKKAGYETEAIEMDKNCSTFLNQTLKIPTFQSADIVHAIQNRPDFNVITLWHVIEHLIDPWQALKAIIDKLHPGGILVIAAPNPDSLQLKLFKKYWHHLDAPRHLSLIPLSLLLNYLKSLGMNPLMTTGCDQGGQTLNRSGWIQSLNHFSKNSLIKKGLRFFGRGMGYLIKHFEKDHRLSSSYTIICKKDHS